MRPLAKKPVPSGAFAVPLVLLAAAGVAAAQGKPAEKAAAAPAPAAAPTPPPAKPAPPPPAARPATAPPPAKAAGAAPSAAPPAAAPVPPAAPAPAAAATTPPPPVEAPKPPAELKEFDWLKGSWRCDGKAAAGSMGPGSPAHTYKASFKVVRALNDFWVVLDYEQRKSKDHALPVKAHGMYGWDPGAKRYVAYGFDSFGGVSIVQGGFDNGTWSATGDQLMEGRKIPWRETMSKKGDREVVVRGEWKTVGDWETLFEDTCKK